MTLEKRQTATNTTKVSLVACPYCGEGFKSDGRPGNEVPSHILKCEAVPTTEEVAEAIHDT